ncbi:MAG TPA: hypothetical protein VGB42_08730 [Candidatus Thermoplasmatota archaeon]
MIRRPVEVGIEQPHATDPIERAPRDVRAALSRHADALRDDAFRGKFVSLQRVPSKPLKRWQGRLESLPNLYKIDLHRGWRALHFVVTDERGQVVFEFEVLTNTELDRFLGYA